MVWAHFDRQGAGQARKSVCKICKREYSGGTSTTILQIHHEQHVGVGEDRFNKEESDKYLVQCLLIHNISPTFLACPYTQRWIHSVRKDYSLPGRTTFSTTLVPQELVVLKENMQAKIKTILSFCISFDGWSSSAVRGYLGLIAHGIDDSWNLQSFLLALRRITQSETAEYVAYLVLEVTKY